MKNKLFFTIFFAFLLTTGIFTPKVTAQTVTCPPLPTNTGIVTMTATAVASGTYVVWSRIMAENTTNNSFYVQIDNACAVLVGDSSQIPPSTWTWINYGNGNSQQIITTSLTQGDHIIKLIGNEPNVKVDKLMLISTDTSCIPTGFGDNCQITTTITPSPASPTPTVTTTPTPSITPIPPTPTRTPTPVVTNTPTPTLTLTPTPTKTPTPTITPSPTLLPTNTQAPTMTPLPQPTTLSLNLLLNAIGNGGDNQAPGSPGNFSPLSPQRQLLLTIFDSNGAQITNTQGLINFNPTPGTFTGLLTLPSVLSPGNYTIKLRTPRYLQKQVAGFMTITSSNQTETIALPQTTLIVGDSNNDNAIDILDYTILTDCFSVLLPPKACTDQIKKTSADLNDDGKVDGTDLNIFLRNAGTQSGN